MFLFLFRPDFVHHCFNVCVKTAESSSIIPPLNSGEMEPISIESQNKSTNENNNLPEKGAVEHVDSADELQDLVIDTEAQEIITGDIDNNRTDYGSDNITENDSGTLILLK